MDSLGITVKPELAKVVHAWPRRPQNAGNALGRNSVRRLCTSRTSWDESTPHVLEGVQAVMIEHVDSSETCQERGELLPHVPANVGPW
jgi:RNase P protein component